MGRQAMGLLLVAVAILLLGASPALAFESHPHQGTIDPSPANNGGVPNHAANNGFGPLAGLAVDAGGGDLYALDTTGSATSGIENSGAAHRFDGAGAYEASFDGSATPATTLSLNGGSDVAVDSSGTASDGHVYITDSGNGVIDVFDEGGAYLSQLDGSTVPTLFFSGPCGLAVDQTNGDLYVADSGNDRIWIFDNTGAYQGRVSDSALKGPCGLALNSEGDLYVRNANDGKVLRFNATGPREFDFGYVAYAPSAGDPENPADDELNATDVAVGADDHVYVPAAVPSGGRILELEAFESSASAIRSFGQSYLQSPTTIAVDPASGKVYVADGQALRVFGATTSLPETTTGDATAIADTTATLRGSVEPAGVGNVECEFEYGPETDPGQPQNSIPPTYAYTDSAPCTPAGPYAGFEEVSADLNGLDPITTYHYRLISSSDNGEVRGEDRTFTTLGLPAIDKTFHSGVNSTAATLGARIDPNGSETTFQFEYGSQGPCESNPCATIPLTAQSIGSADVPEAAAPKLPEDKPDPLATKALLELTPDTTYHYRVIASNAIGNITGPEKSFHTDPLPTATTDTCSNASIRAAQGAGNVGDCRAYELVSPSDKLGGELIGTQQHTQAALDGNAITFASRSGFADVIGSSLMDEYMAQRTPEGWRTHSLMPPQEPQNTDSVTGVKVPSYLQFSDDLTTGVFRALSPLTDDPNVASTRNLYLREDLRTPGIGSYSLISESEAMQPQLGTPPNFTSNFPVFADASADFQHIIFESKLNLTSQATGTATKLYEWDEGTVRLAGILPNGQSAQCSPGKVCSGAGRGASALRYTDTTISQDGSRIFFASPVNANDGAALFHSHLYMRVNDANTAQVDASERAVPISDPQQEQALFQWASADGLKVFFTSGERLTEDDNDEAIDLYRYDASLLDSDPHNLTRIGTSALGVVGISDDASYVYFAAKGPQGVPGETAVSEPTPGLYVWHENQVRFIGTVTGPDEDDMTSQDQSSLRPRTSRVTSDGTVFTFRASRGDGLTGYDHGNSCPEDGTFRPCTEIYVYDATANGGQGELTCASCEPHGAPATSDAQFLIRIGDPFTPLIARISRALTADGSRVFFMSAERLLPADRNGDVIDVYEYDTQAHELHLISSGTGTEDSYFLDASASGDDVFLMTRERLVGSDTDSGYDLYDARAGGGYPEPPPPPLCEGDSCLVAPAAPDAPTPASSSFRGAGNANPARARCPKGKRAVKHKGKSRCVARKHHKRNRANHERRASR